MQLSVGSGLRWDAAHDPEMPLISEQSGKWHDTYAYLLIVECSA